MAALNRLRAIISWLSIVTMSLRDTYAVLVEKRYWSKIVNYLTTAVLGTFIVGDPNWSFKMFGVRKPEFLGYHTVECVTISSFNTQ